MHHYCTTTSTPCPAHNKIQRYAPLLHRHQYTAPRAIHVLSICTTTDEDDDEDEDEDDDDDDDDDDDGDGEDAFIPITKSSYQSRIQSRIYYSIRDWNIPAQHSRRVEETTKGIKKKNKLLVIRAQ